jgi:hypothetical protein
MSRSVHVSGFTFIKNGLTLGYPIKESVESIAPLCDEVVINVGFDDPELKKDDGTWEYLRDHFTHPSYVFLKSWWDPALRSKGLILSQQTNIALEKCQGKIAQYIQGDECIHEADLPVIHNGIIDMGRNKKIEGLVFDYIHFYGNVNIVKHTRNIYRREVRTIRNSVGIKSWLDAQGFRHAHNTKIHAKKIPARIFHYGWARAEQVMQKKVTEMDKLYHHDSPESSFSYERIWGLHPFRDTHPKVMNEWIEKNRNQVDLMKMKFKFEKNTLGLAFSDLLERLTGHRIGEYKNYL